jgi:preprotein translocase subunit YajC
MPGYVVFAQEKDAKAPPKVEAKPESTTGEATTGTPDPSTKQQQPNLELPLILGAVFFLFYFIVLRPQKRRQERERQEQLSLLNKNDRVVTSAGIYGTIVSVSDKEDEVTVKVDDNTRLKMMKASIIRNITREETLKAEKEAKTADKPK